MILKDLGTKENYRDAMVNKVKQYSDMMMTPTKEKMGRKRIDLEYKEVMEGVFKVIHSEENIRKVEEAQLNWSYIKDYHFDAGWFEAKTGLEGAIKLA